MLSRLMQATAITLALYGLLGLNDFQAITSGHQTTEVTVKPTEMLVALKQAFDKRE